jgi:hypothetical protein
MAAAAAATTSINQESEADSHVQFFQQLQHFQRMREDFPHKAANKNENRYQFSSLSLIITSITTADTKAKTARKSPLRFRRFCRLSPQLRAKMAKIL